MEQTKGLDVFINCNCVDLEFDKGSGHLAAVVLSDYERNRQRLVARHFILATGAIENARQLLNSQTLVAAGVVSKEGLVGGCFMEHLNIDLARSSSSPVRTGAAPVLHHRCFRRGVQGR